MDTLLNSNVFQVIRANGRRNQALSMVFRGECPSLMSRFATGYNCSQYDTGVVVAAVYVMFVTMPLDPSVGVVYEICYVLEMSRDRPPLIDKDVDL